MVHFRADDPSEVIDELTAIASRGTGREWITISPWVDPEDLPVVSVLRRMFTARGSKVPEATWVPASGREPAQVGLLHHTGARAYERLLDSDVNVPPAWVKVSDHSKRGLLLAVPPQATADEVLDFILAASAELAEVPIDDRWVAQVSTTDR